MTRIVGCALLAKVVAMPKTIFVRCSSGRGNPLTSTFIGPRIRWTLIMLNAIHMCTGVVMLVLGVEVSSNAHHTPVLQLPSGPGLWCLGILPLTVGVTGLVSAMSARETWISLWVVYSILAHVIGYCLLTLSGCFTTSNYNVNLQIYGSCTQRHNACVCLWHDRSRIAQTTAAPCDTIRFNTTVFLIIITLFVVCLALGVTTVLLALITTCCLRRCIRERPDNSNSSWNSRSMSRNYSTFVTEYVYPNNTRTVLSDDPVSSL